MIKPEPGVKTEPGVKIICPDLNSDIKTDSETDTETDDENGLSISEQDFMIHFNQPVILRKLGDPHL